MRVLLQRVEAAHVIVQETCVGSIGKGLVAFVAVAVTDSDATVDFLVSKLVHLRIFSDSTGHKERSLEETQGQVLLISQFTLYANCEKGRRPDFFGAAPPALARPLYEKFIFALRARGILVETGVFGAHMKVHLVNDGPVTILLERS